MADTSEKPYVETLFNMLRARRLAGHNDDAYYDKWIRDIVAEGTAAADDGPPPLLTPRTPKNRKRGAPGASLSLKKSRSAPSPDWSATSDGGGSPPAALGTPHDITKPSFRKRLFSVTVEDYSSPSRDGTPEGTAKEFPQGEEADDKRAWLLCPVGISKQGRGGGSGDSGGSAGDTLLSLGSLKFWRSP